jgi:LPS-assembly protein
MDLDPFVRFVNDESAYYLSSQLDYEYTRYVVTDPAPGQDERPTRALPVFNTEAGLRFERPTEAGNLQTLEPRMSYVFVPYRNQRQLPRFDTGEPDFDFVELFASNRFSGLDRIADANQLALALTSRLLNPKDGAQQFSASVGQIFRFTTPRVGVGEQGLSNPDKGGTDFIAELDARLTEGFDFTTASQWSPVRHEFVRGSVALRYREGEEGQRRMDLVYRYRDSIPYIDPVTLTNQSVPLSQFDLSGATPLWGPLSVLGRWRYSQQESRSLESLVGMGYETCCWAVRGAARRYQFNTAQQYTTGVYFQLELKGLTRLGAGFQALLPPLE